MSERVASAVEVVNRIVANERDGVVRSLTADKGYFAIEEIAQIQELIFACNRGRPRCPASQGSFERAAAQSSASAACAVKSQSGKALLRKRGTHLERSFEHLLDEGGLPERPSRKRKISLSATRSRRPALI